MLRIQNTITVVNNKQTCRLAAARIGCRSMHGSGLELNFIGKQGRHNSTSSLETIQDDLFSLTPRKRPNFRPNALVHLISIIDYPCPVLNDTRLLNVAGRRNLAATSYAFADETKTTPMHVMPASTSLDFTLQHGFVISRNTSRMSLLYVSRAIAVVATHAGDGLWQLRPSARLPPAHRT